MLSLKQPLKQPLRAALVAITLALAGAFLVQPVQAVEGQAMMLPVDPAPLVAKTADGERHFTVEIADDPGERARGLMFRADMPDDRGMLFVFETTQPVAFWMKNTPMPLDMVFIEPDGTIASIQKGEPFSEATVSTMTPVRFVLELKHGTAARVGLRAGDKLWHPIIEAAGRRG